MHDLSRSYRSDAFFTSLVLPFNNYMYMFAFKGGRVIMACRDRKACEEAKAEIREKIPNRNIECRKLNLASIESIKEFANVVLECKFYLS